MVVKTLPEFPVKKGEPAYKIWIFEPGWKGEIPLNFNLRQVAEQKRSALLPGHRLCAGCAAPIVVKLASFAFRGPTIVVNATGCLEVASTIFPYTSWAVPWIHNAFENAASTAAGVESAIKALKKTGRLPYEHVDVVVFAGDGGTFDIGFQALSGMAERGHDVLYILYDNEAYMNTGIQRSGGTPKYAATTTSPAGEVIPGKPESKKPIADIMVAHRIPYVATATPAHWMDFMKKVRKGLEVNGPGFIHSLSSCDRGWRHDNAISIEVLRRAVDTCYFPLWEWTPETGYMLTDRSLVIARNPSLKQPIERFVEVQGRFRHLMKPENKEKLKELQEYVDKVWEDLLKRASNAPK
ncbi:thiamine pyrophosphate-dependent enzyme [Thermosphaera aggregans]|jgi:pyruvate ferredoxin oxidoreductase beta subunit|uniref:2-oxoacid oxidoreductase (ferredoxin) n=1 Tax=Thermosphaera aggregans (strain DSM 11486 / M11TL) TaxID=633148 RepID=D5U0L1_THEAM|nr:thiamine pyrophosphate-dependent enzyme [Thermosphaera aggregans]ADG90661.1 thiamine pyrophosphate protein domain protein TPP-binding protein [Thermosphaera aggregans DSM 11486]